MAGDGWLSLLCGGRLPHKPLPGADPTPPSPPPQPCSAQLPRLRAHSVSCRQEPRRPLEARRRLEETGGRRSPEARRGLQGLIAAQRKARSSSVSSCSPPAPRGVAHRTSSFSPGSLQAVLPTRDRGRLPNFAFRSRASSVSSSSSNPSSAYSSPSSTDSSSSSPPSPCSSEQFWNQYKRRPPSSSMGALLRRALVNRLPSRERRAASTEGRARTSRSVERGPPPPHLLLGSKGRSRRGLGTGEGYPPSGLGLL